MPTRAVLIAAGPTPWDVEGRIVGNSSLPLTAEAMDAIRHLLDKAPSPINGVYRAAANEACEQVSQMIARKHGIRPRDNRDLDEVRMGLWQGLFPEDIRTRFPTVFRQWEEQPLAVTPPDGEPLEAAIQRIRAALNRIARKSKGLTIAVALRPMAFQIARGILRVQSPVQIAGRLRERLAIETIEIDPAAMKALLE
ncbi:MAG TPA: histidine phosphatase family protein [Tepidisphaeraceae bacterium]|jgi:broad specificity phosphatase PhoE|nr:histidine phosphatase family protein [Tepidisphaeraceae bacterium]